MGNEIMEQEAAEDQEMLETPPFDCNEMCVMYVRLNEAFEVSPLKIPEGCVGCPNLPH